MGRERGGEGRKNEEKNTQKHFLFCAFLMRLTTDKTNELLNMNSFVLSLFYAVLLSLTHKLPLSLSVFQTFNLISFCCNANICVCLKKEKLNKVLRVCIYECGLWMQTTTECGMEN